MARPSSHDDVDSYRKTELVARFYPATFLASAQITAAYAAFVRAAEKLGAKADSNGEVTRTLNTDELDTILASDQKSWDTTDKRYHEVAAAVEDGAMGELKNKWQDYESFGLRHHAKREGYQILALIQDDEDTRKAARVALGLS